MAQSSNTIDVYLEIGKKRTFASAVEWPGWTRRGRDEADALQALLEAGPRYARILGPVRLDFQTPDDASAFVVAERLEGNMTTDFGTPGRIPTGDAHPVDDGELQRLQSVLKACWQALDAAVARAEGRTLRVGPRGGGRDLDRIVQHVREGEAGYTSSLGGKIPANAAPDKARQIVLEALAASAHGEIAEYGVRGGKRWPPRYFVRRAAWHVLDHAWEIEDRSQ